MNRIATSIRNRLSLRPPQEKSLNILAELADKLTLKKSVDLTAELEKVKSSYPTCSDFERNFPSLCFALATGVGKTRLMGAFITYLYLEKGIKISLCLHQILLFTTSSKQSSRKRPTQNMFFRALESLFTSVPALLQAITTRIFVKGDCLNLRYI